MWNNWVEKAKDLASNIDQQLNEAVGADADPNNPLLKTGAITGTSTSNSLLNVSVAASATETTNVDNTITGSGDDDDAWNDDFDFGDDDDDDGGKDGDSSGDKDKNDPKTTESQSTADGDVKPLGVSEPSGTPNDSTAADATTTSPVSPPAEISPSQAEEPPSTSEVVSTANDNPAEQDLPQQQIQPPTPETPAEETPAEAGWDDDNDDLEFSNNNEEVGDVLDEAGKEKASTDKKVVENSRVDLNANVVKDEGTSSEELPADTAVNDSSDQPMAGQDSLSVEAVDPLISPPPVEETETPIPESTVTDTTPTDDLEPDNGVKTENDDNNTENIKDKPSLFSNLAHRAEGFAHRAEGLAHQAEGGVSSLLAAASHIGDNIVHSTGSKDDSGDSTDTNNLAGSLSPSAAAAASKNVSSIFASALSGATAAVISATGSEDKGTSVNVDNDDVGKGNGSQNDAWDEDDDIDITETEGADETVPVEQVSKALESQSDNVAKDPTETNDDETQAADRGHLQAEEQSGAEETTSFVSVSGPESVLVESTETSPLSSDAEKHDHEPSLPGDEVQATDASVPFTNIENDPRFIKLKQQLRLREDQLANKAEQLNELQSLMESQEADYKKKLSETKEEAKKRIQRAKERCEAAEKKLMLNSTSGAEDSAKQEGIIKALREEGQALAMKQAAMEQAVRAAKAESRQMAEQLDDEAGQKEDALEKIAKLEMELKITKESLSAARKGESQAGKLESDLLAARSDAETKANTILSLQQQIKELTAESKELRNEIQNTQKAAAHEAQQEKSTLRREHNDLIADLEVKLRTTEREAGVREDALRHEVAELRKRWQDAVRRADALSMDIQSSTAPLLRQLESMERQNRARAANWAELEGRLRNDLEESVIQNENLSKDRSEFKAKISRLERLLKESTHETTASQETVEEQSAKIEKLEGQLQKMEDDAVKRQEEYEKVERLANEGVARVRSEMTQTVVESEERYRGQIDRLEDELKVEKEKRSQLESQVNHLLENAGGILGAQAQNAPQAMRLRQESKPKKLRESEGQAEILAGALGIEDSDDESGFDTDDDELDGDMHNGVTEGGDGGNRRGSSFAALEQLTSRLKTAEVELKSLRKSLRDSELTRESLVEELADSRHAKEKLPLFEAKVKELTEDNREKELEILGLKEDILEVKELYRTQLNVLLEEKASENVQTNDRRHSSPADVLDTTASTVSNNNESSQALPPVNEPVIA